MKLFKYLLYISVFTYCGCSDAAPKEKTSDLRCPLTLPAEKDMLAGWQTVGKIPAEKLPLKSIGIISPDTSDISKRIFSEEIIEEWETVNHADQAVEEYDATHENLMLKCIYARSYSEASNDNDKNVVILIPLPPKKAFTCLLIRRPINPEFEASCKVK